MSTYWSEFGEKMARLHTFNSSLKEDGKRKEQFVHENKQFTYVDKFGSTLPRFFGEFRLASVQRDTWEEYFVGEIMNPLVQGTVEKYGDRELLSKWSWLQLHLPKLFKDVKITPEIIHSDLCVANFGQTDDGPVLFDPSLTYAHHEMDLLLSVTEEKFHDDFVKSYFNLLPRKCGFEKILEAYRLFYNVIMWYHVDEEQFKHGSYHSMQSVTELIKAC